MSGEPQRKPTWTPSGEQAAGGLVAGAEKVMKDAGKTMLSGASKAERIVLNRIPGAPGLILDGVSIATAKGKPERDRAIMEAGGGMAGGALGALVGGPLGAVVGSTLGQKGGELLYDHQDDIKAWMKAREQEIARGLMNRVQPYMLPPQYRQRY